MSQKNLQNMAINLSSNISRAYTQIPLASFFIYFAEFLSIIWIEKGSIVSIFCFPQTDIREQQKYNLQKS